MVPARKTMNLAIIPARGGSKRWKPGHGTHKRGLNTKIHLIVDAHGMPVRVLVTESTRANCKEAVHLIEGISAQALLMDRGYDTNEIVAHALSAVRCIAIWATIRI